MIYCPLHILSAFISAIPLLFGSHLYFSSIFDKRILSVLIKGAATLPYDAHIGQKMRISSGERHKNTALTGLSAMAEGVRRALRRRRPGLTPVRGMLRGPWSVVRGPGDLRRWQSFCPRRQPQATVRCSNRMYAPKPQSTKPPMVSAARPNRCPRKRPARMPVELMTIVAAPMQSAMTKMLT